jgi:hypothetical protein
VVAGDGQVWVQIEDERSTPDTGGLVGRFGPATGSIARTVHVNLGGIPRSSGDGYSNPPFGVSGGNIWSAQSALQRTTP